jgi:hypothetical protein
MSQLASQSMSLCLCLYNCCTRRDERAETETAVTQGQPPLRGLRERPVSMDGVMAVWFADIRALSAGQCIDVHISIGTVLLYMDERLIR